jgi:hypothetical protein
MTDEEWAAIDVLIEQYTDEQFQAEMNRVACRCAIPNCQVCPFQVNYS